ncbi:hypothetical protein GCM10009647_089540 [Streptomyces sanglieri]
MPELTIPTGRLHSSWLAARDGWTPGAHQDGAGSARSIELNGGVLEDVRTTKVGIKRRYWITLWTAGVQPCRLQPLVDGGDRQCRSTAGHGPAVGVRRQAYADGLRRRREKAGTLIGVVAGRTSSVSSR